MRTVGVLVGMPAYVSDVGKKDSLRLRSLIGEFQGYDLGWWLLELAGGIVSCEMKRRFDADLLYVTLYELPKTFFIIIDFRDDQVHNLNM